LLPDEVDGWRAAGAVGVYNADTLHELIDGGAEVYRSFNVQTVLSRRYEKQSAPDIIIDLFDMGSAPDAFGAYHHDMREGRDAGVGQESELLGSNLTFWKDRFFVSIIPFADSDELRKTVLVLGRSVAQAIPRDGVRPELVALLPPTGLVRSQVHYFHDWRLLNRHRDFAEENLLHLDRQTAGVLARYRARRPPAEKGDVTSLSLLLVRYPSPERARKAFESFVDGYLPGADADGLTWAKDPGWSGTRVTENLFVGVFDAPSKRDVLDLLREVEKRRNR
jgi:hypothetical protein